mmetsp:Transcript_23129/g.33885  ORF Transcript_23129/g.33885 Transcript_23129/m.33885 type:complete len:159 (+) Transcript_23129:106-582(+)
MSFQSQCVFYCAVLFSLCALTRSQPEGWRMVDRFYGFRYEISGSNLFDVGFEDAVAKQADSMGCFGWIQKSAQGTLVGEARCNKVQGPKFQEWLGQGISGSTISSFDTKIYPDTKIRLHFSSFKVLDEGRDTCFLDSPHQCPEFDEEAAESKQGHTEL